MDSDVERKTSAAEHGRPGDLADSSQGILLRDVCGFARKRDLCASIVVVRSLATLFFYISSATSHYFGRKVKHHSDVAFIDIILWLPARGPGHGPYRVSLF